MLIKRVLRCPEPGRPPISNGRRGVSGVGRVEFYLFRTLPWDLRKRQNRGRILFSFLFSFIRFLDISEHLPWKKK